MPPNEPFEQALYARAPVRFQRAEVYLLRSRACHFPSWVA
jgi:hypothetical protein